MDFSPFIVFSTAALISWLLLRLLIPSLCVRLLDRPNERSSHSQSTPSGGGVSFVLLVSLANVAALIFSPVSSPETNSILFGPLFLLPLATVGFLDDLYKLPASWRYFVHCVSAFAVLSISPLTSHLAGTLPVIVLSIILITAFINFINFMDGVDGLVSGCMLVFLVTVCVHHSFIWPLWVNVGSLLGFIIWNWSPARVFMGDVGSTFLGGLLALYVLHSSTWIEAFSLLLVATPILGDACICVFRRLLTGQRVFQAHRLHLFQRLHQAGWSHASVSTFYILATFLLALAFVLGGFNWVLTLCIIELLLGCYLDQRVAVPFSVASSL